MRVTSPLRFWSIPSHPSHPRNPSRSPFMSLSRSLSLPYSSFDARTGPPSHHPLPLPLLHHNPHHRHHHLHDSLHHNLHHNLHHHYLRPHPHPNPPTHPPTHPKTKTVNPSPPPRSSQERPPPPPPWRARTLPKRRHRCARTSKSLRLRWKRGRLRPPLRRKMVSPGAPYM